jgi:hypothetical protein
MRRIRGQHTYEVRLSRRLSALRDKTYMIIRNKSN